MTRFDFLFHGYHAFPMNHVWWPSVAFLVGRGGRDSFLVSVFLGVVWELIEIIAYEMTSDYVIFAREHDTASSESVADALFLDLGNAILGGCLAAATMRSLGARGALINWKKVNAVDTVFTVIYGLLFSAASSVSHHCVKWIECDEGSFVFPYGLPLIVVLNALWCRLILARVSNDATANAFFLNSIVLLASVATRVYWTIITVYIATIALIVFWTLRPTQTQPKNEESVV